MSVQSEIDTNKCIRAILDEYYEVESLDGAKEDGNGNLYYESSNLQKKCTERHTHQIPSTILGYCGNGRQINNITPSTICSNPSNIDHCSSDRNKYDESSQIKGESCTSEGVQEMATNLIPSPSKSKVEVNIGNLKTTYSTAPEDKGGSEQKSEQDHSKKLKKPFLKKGSRKEPSSLQRANKEVLRKGMRFSNDGKGCIVKNTKDAMTSNPDALAHLEQMQQEQLQNLDKRIERRQRARQEIRRKQIDFKRNKSSLRKYIDSDDKYNHDDDPDKAASLDTSSSSVSESYDEFESSDTSGDESNNTAHNGGYVEYGKKDTNQKQTIKDEPEPSKRQNKSPVKNMPQPRSPLKCKDKVYLKKGSKIDFKSPELKEQWQVIKSMRKRQEAALRTAEKEREEAKSWANNERLSVQKWTEQQRHLIQKERKRVTNEMLTIQKKKRQDSLEERAASALESNQKGLQSEIEQLTETLHKHKIDTDAIKSRFRLNEKKLKDSIAHKEHEIDSLKEEIEQLTVKYSKAQAQIDQLSKTRSKVKRKKKNKDCRKGSIQLEILDGSNNDGDDATKALAPEHTNKDKKQNHYNCCEEERHASEEDLPELKRDKQAIAIIKKRDDLIDEPKEKWLSKHIQSEAEEVKDYEHDKILYSSLMKGKKYDPLKYSSTPQTTPPEDNSSNDECLIKNQNDASHQLHCFYDEHDSNRITTYKNGTQKEILPDGTTIIRFLNGDVKTRYSTVGIVVYYYAESKTSHTTHPDGLEIFEFASGQIERHYPNGRKEVSFPDGTHQTFLPNGDKMNKFPDGINVLESHMGKKVIHQTFDQR